VTIQEEKRKNPTETHKNTKIKEKKIHKRLLMRGERMRTLYDDDDRERNIACDEKRK